MVINWDEDCIGVRQERIIRRGEKRQVDGWASLKAAVRVAHGSHGEIVVEERSRKERVPKQEPIVLCFNRSALTSSWASLARLPRLKRRSDLDAIDGWGRRDPTSKRNCRSRRAEGTVVSARDCEEGAHG